ncbi:hypothetical protein [Sphingomonas prati]|uniref:Uncharacterized protein n=1 Tax=Sphingomonas prati TaxID=1843237 RepID=A0A7W9BW75_9SPHN|nr:hypothetical protein [Sphingomonas prati]MBB5730778.1 hypothetical protein [Sphingomonas prati]GGE96704.1 hypothetical protein GCM10011404_32290 [Sphingomonas prati]
MRRGVTSGVIAVGVAVFVALLVIPRGPAAVAGENGTFANDCCGTFALSNGKMVLNGQRTVRYTVATDGEGPYILPLTDVGTMPDHGFAVDGSRSVRKLRLDRLPNPTRITLYEGLIPYIFKRQAPRLRN